MTLRTALLTLACLAGSSGVALGQKQASDTVGKEYRPPKGMCRIWLDKVPPKQQPAPTDCPTAVRNKPTNARVIFGDDYKEKGDKDPKKELPFLKKFAESPKP
ncbi:MAG: hypothetical protein ABJE47_05325 [bacterium]